MSDSCQCQCQSRQTLVFACSGAADVGELADRAARRLARDGSARMLCTAAIGAGIEDTLEIARSASIRLVIDGCDLLCAARCLQHAGLDDFVHLRLADLGMCKGKSPVDSDRTDRVVKEALNRLEVSR
jgi:uncharacterized metal-binding protein